MNKKFLRKKFGLFQIVLNDSMSAKALGPVCDSREQAAPLRPSNSVLSGSDRHDFAVSQGLDIANRGSAQEGLTYGQAETESALYRD